MSIKVSITNEKIGYPLYDPDDNNCVRKVTGRVADFCLTNKVFNVLTLGYVHAFIHELGHAVAYRVLSGGSATINLTTASCYGSYTRHDDAKRPLSSVGATWVDLSGPLANIIFSVVLIVGIFAITYYAPMSPTLSLILRIGIAAPAAFWIMGEFFYAAVSISKQDSGDFGKIASRGWAHLLVALAILVAICAIGVIGAVMLL